MYTKAAKVVYRGKEGYPVHLNSVPSSAPQPPERLFVMGAGINNDPHIFNLGFLGLAGNALKKEKQTTVFAQLAEYLKALTEFLNQELPYTYCFIHGLSAGSDQVVQAAALPESILLNGINAGPAGRYVSPDNLEMAIQIIDRPKQLGNAVISRYQPIPPNEAFAFQQPIQINRRNDLITGMAQLLLLDSATKEKSNSVAAVKAALMYGKPVAYIPELVSTQVIDRIKRLQDQTQTELYPARTPQELHDVMTSLKTPENFTG